jgi:hypothetical protein
MPITSLISGILPLFYHGGAGGVLCTFGFLRIKKEAVANHLTTIPFFKIFSL